MMLLDVLEESARTPSYLLFPSERPDKLQMSELWRRSADAADWFSARTDPDDHVAMVLRATPRGLAALLGAWRAGLVVVSLPDPVRVGSEAYAMLLRRVADEVDIRTAVLPPPAVGHIGPSAGIDLVTPVEVEAGGPRGRRYNVGRFVQLTSGSTGSPAGVRLSMAAISANVHAVVEQLRGESDQPVMCSWLPLSHDMGLFGGCLAPLAAGASTAAGTVTCLIDTARFARRPTIWLRTCSEIKATVTLASNTALEICSRLGSGRGGIDLSSIESCVVGAERIRPSVVDHFVAAYASAGLSPVAVRPAYGLAENTLAVSLAPAATPIRCESIDGELTDAVSCGTRVAGTEVRIEDGPIGEIAIRGSSLFDGYLGSRPERRRDGWFLTGDLGTIVDGELYPLGRVDDQVTVRGVNLTPDDIEALVIEVASPAIRAVVVVPDAPAGYAIVAEAASAEALSGTIVRLRAECARRVGIAPSRIVPVRRGTLPRTASGKLRRKLIARQLGRQELTVLAHDRAGWK